MPELVDGLADHLRALIAREGPITVERFMAETLGHPEYGYYRKGDPLGAAGDFITSPEITQVFGELIGAWCAVVWQQMGRPDPVRLVELGPGRGTLMADALRAIARTAGEFHAALRLHLVETSPALRAKQEAALGPANATWHEDLRAVPLGPMLLVANEFFDALPIQQFVRQADGWHQRLVDTNGGGFCFALSPEAVTQPVDLEKNGAIVEACPAGLAMARQIGRRLKAQGGAALIVDYGYAPSAAGDTLQAVRGHTFHDVLDAPGTADLTAHVDFAALARAAGRAGVKNFGPVPQGAFLSRLGLHQRIDTLAGAADPTQAAELRAAGRRLIDAKEMGTLFKVLALSGPDQPPPPGFHDDL